MRQYQREPGIGSVQLQSWEHESSEEHRTSAPLRLPAADAVPAVAIPRVGTGVTTSLKMSSRFNARSPTVARSSLLQLQRSHGNHYVQQVLQLARGAASETDVAPDVERAIETSRGGGQPLDSAVGAQIGQALNADFSGVRVHTSSEADNLNRALNARAFTTGRDIYFRQGEYNPGSSGGRELLAHELTHVVQQNGGQVQAKKEDEVAAATGEKCATGKSSRAVQPKLTLGSPGDIYEQEADNVARALSRWEQQSGHSQDTGIGIRRQGIEEEDKEKTMRTKPQSDWLLRQVEEDREEKEALQTKREVNEVRRQPEEEEEKKKTETA